MASAQYHRQSLDVTFSYLSTQPMTGNDNLYIPKFILNVPWYYRELQDTSNDAFRHQRRDPTDSSIEQGGPLAGTGINDTFKVVDGVKLKEDEGDFAAKRDRWHGYDAAEWDEIFSKWDSIKKSKKPQTNAPDDSDDTDYELELQELGIDRKEFTKGFVEDPVERSIRERKYTPAYILAINANEGGKIRIGKDSTRGIANDDSDFVRQISKDERDLNQMQQFAWEQNKQYELQKLRELYQKQLADLSNPSAEAVDTTVPVELGFSVEASPTLMMMKKKEEDKKKKEAGEKRKRSLLDRYGSE